MAFHGVLNIKDKLYESSSCVAWGRLALEVYGTFIKMELD